MRLLVTKFGGTSVGSAAAIRALATITAQNRAAWDGVVVVVSALSGVTDSLLRIVRTAQSGDAVGVHELYTALRLRHDSTIDELLTTERAAVRKDVDGLLDECAKLCEGVRVLGELTLRTLDAITGLGERMSARIVAATLREHGIAASAYDATDLIVTDDRYQDASPLMPETIERTTGLLGPVLAAGSTPVITGFIGATLAGVKTTLGRGGSDWSAAILGAALEASEVWIYTDVDGVLTADPRTVPDARVIPTLSYNEVSELAYFGAKVLHPKTIRPVVERGIALRVKNTFNPTHSGTLIVQQTERIVGAIKAVTSVHSLSLITVMGRGMLGVPGIAARTFAAIARQNASILMISQASSEQSICCVIPAGTTANVVASLRQELAAELERRDIDTISVDDNVAIITAVGAGMRGTSGVAKRVFGVVGDAEINVIAIAQGSSECAISLVVSEADARAAVRAIHTLTHTETISAHHRAPCE
ncbi:MAG: aspartate kinase [Herpetosiphonaceae bacterium]|nr:aspartate kinase [Herpetosiphonaceae bacterium]